MIDLSSNVDSSSSLAGSQDHRVPLSTKFFFGVGTIGETASNWIFLSLAFFITNESKVFRLRLRV